jgi:hypothetical protein
MGYRITQNKAEGERAKPKVDDESELKRRQNKPFILPIILNSEDFVPQKSCTGRVRLR